MLTAEVAVVVGKRGYGKSSLARWLVTQMPRAMVLDPMGHDYAGDAIVATGAELAAALHERRGRDRWTVVMRPAADSDVAAYWSIARRALSDCWLVVDEIDRWATPAAMPEDVRWQINYGRHRRLSLLGIARRPHRVARDLTAAADCILALRVTERRDLDYLAEYMPTDELPALAPHHWRGYGRLSLLADKGGA